MAQRLPATTGLSKAAQKELPECVDYGVLLLAIYTSPAPNLQDNSPKL